MLCLPPPSTSAQIKHPCMFLTLGFSFLPSGPHRRAAPGPLRALARLFSLGDQTGRHLELRYLKCKSPLNR